jgi:hypothetical protein
VQCAGEDLERGIDGKVQKARVTSTRDLANHLKVLPESIEVEENKVDLIAIGSSSGICWATAANSSRRSSNIRFTICKYSESWFHWRYILRRNLQTFQAQEAREFFGKTQLSKDDLKVIWLKSCSSTFLTI